MGKLFVLNARKNKEVSDLTKKEYDTVVAGYEKLKESKGD